MKIKFIIKWMWFEGNKQLFLGFGFIIGKHYIGLTISNLFIGLEK